MLHDGMLQRSAKADICERLDIVRNLTVVQLPLSRPTKTAARKPFSNVDFSEVEEV
jgi:hypothetical protein